MFRYYQIFFKVIFVFSLLILTTVYLMEYVWNMKPCELCRYERLPYFLMMFTAYIGYFMSKFRKIISIAVVVFAFFGVTISFFHVGVENAWFNYDSSCIANSVKSTTSIDILKSQILSKDLVPCDASQYSFIWVSIAGWNFIVISVIFVFSAIFSFSLMRTAQYDKF